MSELTMFTKLDPNDVVTGEPSVTVAIAFNADGGSPDPDILAEHIYEQLRPDITHPELGIPDMGEAAAEDAMAIAQTLAGVTAQCLENAAFIDHVNPFREPDRAIFKFGHNGYVTLDLRLIPSGWELPDLSAEAPEDAVILRDPDYGGEPAYGEPTDADIEAMLATLAELFGDEDDDYPELDG